MNAHVKVLGVLSMLALIVSVSIALPIEQDLQPASASSTPELHKGKTAAFWHWRYVKAHRAHSRLGELLRDERRAHRESVRMLTRQLAIRGEGTAITAIRLVFGSYAEQAIRVSACETGHTFSTGATNGQYLGLFQMGNYARGRYGHSDSALGQAQAAYRYFIDSGRDWSPWACKP